MKAMLSSLFGTSLSRSLSILGLAAALVGAGAGHGAFAARGTSPYDGPAAVAEAPAATVTAARSDDAATPAQRFLERSGATGSEGQHS